MGQRIAIVTGSGGLIGSECVKFLSDKFDIVIGFDNNKREYFFGTEASVRDNILKLRTEIQNYEHHNFDISNRNEMFDAFNAISKQAEISLVIHCAAQPSHDWAAKEPFTDFDTNAAGTLNLLEMTRNFCPNAVFIFTSTNKVYGDTPNYLPLIEQDNRWEIDKEHKYWKGIDESMSIDNSTHSIFGVSKLAADVMVQEYGKYFGMKTGVFRGGCLTGPCHKGAKLHGFLSFLYKTMAKDEKYSVLGYKGKQVRDNIHSSDLVKMFWEFYQKPRFGEVYNVGGGRENSISVLEAIQIGNEILKEFGREWNDFEILDQNRIGDHIWYISDLNKFKSHYPEWQGITISVKDIARQIITQELTQSSVS